MLLVVTFVFGFFRFVWICFDFCVVWVVDCFPVICICFGLFGVTCCLFCCIICCLMWLLIQCRFCDYFVFRTLFRLVFCWSFVCVWVVLCFWFLFCLTFSCFILCLDGLLNYYIDLCIYWKFCCLLCFDWFVFILVVYLCLRLWVCFLVVVFGVVFTCGLLYAVFRFWVGFCYVFYLLLLFGVVWCVIGLVCIGSLVGCFSFWFAFVVCLG